MWLVSNLHPWTSANFLKLLYMTPWAIQALPECLPQLPGSQFAHTGVDVSVAGTCELYEEYRTETEKGRWKGRRYLENVS